MCGEAGKKKGFRLPECRQRVEKCSRPTESVKALRLQKKIICKTLC